MALDDDIRILSGVGLFAELTQEQLRLLAFGAETMRFAAGREIYRENATADCAYVIARGEVVLYRESGETWRVECWRSFADYCFGMLAEGAADAAH